MKRVGIDIGSLYLSGVVIEDGEVKTVSYTEHKGNIEAEVGHLLGKPGYDSYDRIGISGIVPGRTENAIDSTLATIEGVLYLLPECRNVFAVGGEAFSLIFFDEKGKYKEHTVNTPCAAGTGSFIEQQAERLGLSVADLSRRAMSYKEKNPLIATRCAVFAKTDITHAMQEGFSLDAICAGLCEGIARNIVDVLVKGREIVSPAAVVGGVSLNTRVVDALSEILEVRIIVPKHSHLAAAIGAALLGTDSRFGFHHSGRGEGCPRNMRPGLEMQLTHYPDLGAFTICNHKDVEVFLPKHKTDSKDGVYIGIDIGSTSTKAAFINGKREFVGGFYTSTGGQPIDAVQKLIKTASSTFKDQRLIPRGVGTTGSGRKMIKELLNAEMAINEITAHARAALFLNPEVDTIIEIGGQDSKFTRLQGGEVSYSIMNYVCAAGTGSFIEEQAKRLNVNLKDFSDIAFGSKAPYTSDRCTVYMERDLGLLLSEGWSKEAVAAAVLNSVRDNYMAKVVGRNPVGDYVVFQGATARNAALVASFEQLLHKPMHVSPYCHLTGALGAALLCLESGFTKSHFLWDPSKVNLEKEICAYCANRCLLTVVVKNGKRNGWGMKCGREYGDKSEKTSYPTLAETRLREGMKPLFEQRQIRSQRKKVHIGIPNALYNMEYSPLWYSFFSRLGFTVRITEPSRNSLYKGKKAVNSDFCAPMILAHGYIEQLLDEGVDYIFCPAIVNEKDKKKDTGLLFRDKTRDSYFCYYSQYLPTIVQRLTSFQVDKKLLSPLISFNEETSEQIVQDIYETMKPGVADLGLDETRECFMNAFEEFQRTKKKKKPIDTGREGYKRGGERLRIVLMGRPYVVFDPVINMKIPEKLEEMGAELYWQNDFSLEDYAPLYANKFYERMHWYYGKRIIKVAEHCARSEDLFVVYLTCFRCSPDSFLTSYVKDIMAYYNKPLLVLQLDEHSSDVGYTTRIEAAFRSFENFMKKKTNIRKHPVRTRARNDRLEEGDTVLISYLDQLISQFWVQSFRRVGYEALLLDADEKSLNTGYQYVNGGECMPLVSIVGSVVETVKRERLVPEKTFLYLPTICLACNFPQFPILADHVFRSAGLKGLKIGLISSMAPGDFISQNLSKKLLESYIVGCIVYKMYNRIQPYEEREGETQQVFQGAKEFICNAILSGMSLRTALSEVVRLFKGIRRDESGGRRPRIGLIGDLYVKYNEVVNQRVQTLVRELGGELIVPSMTEYPFHFYDADIRLYGDDPRHFRILRSVEQRYETIAFEIIGDQTEPDFAECLRLMKEYDIKHSIAGETSINVGRALYYIEKKLVDAILHINPMFCCPGVVTSSLYRKIQKDFKIPIIDIFYDGTGNPNRVLVPHLHYLKQRGGTERR